LRGQDFKVCAWSDDIQARVLSEAAALARAASVALVLSIERVTPAGSQISAAVIDADGHLVGWQSKNQLDPSEDQHYVPGRTRRVFEVEGVRFGIVTCHEGFRYPETVRWAALRGARIVFHPQHTGSNSALRTPSAWGAPEGAYYEKAMMCRGLENTIYFASVNYALTAPEAATSLITPVGECQAYLPYGEEGVLVARIDPEQANGRLAGRFAPDRYQDEA
jgi:predicted amidohydrolase